MSTDHSTAAQLPSSPASSLRPVAPMDPEINSTQPGGGVCMRIELAWGALRRRLLKRLRPGYVRRMRAARRGEGGRYPHEIIDSRDLKFHANQGDYHWAREDDPLAWRDRIPLARAGLAEVVLIGGSMLLLTVGLLFVFPPAAIAPAALGAAVLWFFRDPARTPPADLSLVVAPADGRVASITELEHDDLLGGPAVSICIFLSVFNVHINRAPTAGQVIGLSYRRGKFLNALRSESAGENECLEVRLQEDNPPYRAMRVRQIAGAIARRIVCTTAPGRHLARGERFGMIKFGSRTELVLPREAGLALLARPGLKVRAGVTPLAKYANGPEDALTAESPPELGS